MTEAKAMLTTGAKQGNAAAQNLHGAMYQHGRAVTEDYAESARWTRKAAEQSYAYAQRNLGLLYGMGKGIPKDFAEAVRWFKKAAGQDIPKRSEFSLTCNPAELGQVDHPPEKLMQLYP